MATSKLSPFAQLNTTNPKDIANALRVIFPKENILKWASNWKAEQEAKHQTQVVNILGYQQLKSLYQAQHNALTRTLATIEEERSSLGLLSIGKTSVLDYENVIRSIDLEIEKIGNPEYMSNCLAFFNAIIEELQKDEDPIEDLRYESTDLVEDVSWVPNFEQNRYVDTRLFEALPGMTAESQAELQNRKRRYYGIQCNKEVTFRDQSARHLRYGILNSFQSGKVTLLVTPERIYPCKILKFSNSDGTLCNESKSNPLAIPPASTILLGSEDYYSEVESEYLYITTDNLFKISGDVSEQMAKYTTVEENRYYSVEVKDDIYEYIDDSNNPF